MDDSSDARAEGPRLDRLVERHRQFLEERFPFWGRSQANALARQVDDGSLTIRPWTARDERAIGVAWVQTADGGLRVHGLWTEPTGPGPVTELLADLPRERAGTVQVVTDVLPGFDAEAQEDHFAGLGYWHRAKVLIRRSPDAARIAPPRSPRIRPIAPTDLLAVTRVYAAAYADRPGEFWAWAVPSAAQEAERDLRRHLGPTGGWSDSFLADASQVWDDAGTVRGAVLLGRGGRGHPWVDDLIVEPAFHRQGIGRALLEAAIAQVTSQGPENIDLAAIRFGAPYRLYRRVGFEEVPPPEGRLDGHWVRGPSPF